MAGHEWDWFQREELIGQISDIRVQNLQVERENIQKRTFTRWMNLHLEKCCPPLEVKDLFADIQDGKILMALLEVLSGQSLLQEFKASTHRIFRLNNIAKSLKFLEDRNVKLVSIDAAEIADGNCSIVLGLIWNIILFFQIKELTGNLKTRFSSCSSLSSMQNDGDYDNSQPTPPPCEKLVSHSMKDQRKAIKVLLHWVQKRTNKYGVVVQEFGSSWKSGLAFLAIIKAIDPSLVDMTKALEKSPRENLEDAFRIAYYSLGIPRLLEPEDVMVSSPDEQSLVTYVSQFLEHFPELEPEDVPEDVCELPIDTTELHTKDASLQAENKIHILHRNGEHTYVVNSNSIHPPPPKIFVRAASEDTEECSSETVHNASSDQQQEPSRGSSPPVPEKEASKNVQNGSFRSPSIQPAGSLNDETDSSAEHVSNNVVQAPDSRSDLKLEDGNNYVSELGMTNFPDLTNYIGTVRSATEKLEEPASKRGRISAAYTEASKHLLNHSEPSSDLFVLDNPHKGVPDTYSDVLDLKKEVSPFSDIPGARSNLFKHDEHAVSTLRRETHPQILSDEEDDAYKYILDLHETENAKESSSMNDHRDAPPARQISEINYYLTERSKAPEVSREHNPDIYNSSLCTTESSTPASEMLNNPHDSPSSNAHHSSKVSIIPLDIVYYPHYNVAISEVIEAYAEPGFTDFPIHEGRAGQLSASCLQEPPMERLGPNDESCHQSCSAIAGRPPPTDACLATSEAPAATIAEATNDYRESNSDVLSASFDASAVYNNQEEVQPVGFAAHSTCSCASADGVLPENSSLVHPVSFTACSTHDTASVDDVLPEDSSEVQPVTFAAYSTSMPATYSRSVPVAGDGVLSEGNSEVEFVRFAAYSTSVPEAVDGVLPEDNSEENSVRFVAYNMSVPATLSELPDENSKVQQRSNVFMEERGFESYGEEIPLNREASENHDLDGLQATSGPKTDAVKKRKVEGLRSCPEVKEDLHMRKYGAMKLSDEREDEQLETLQELMLRRTDSGDAGSNKVNTASCAANKEFRNVAEQNAFDKTEETISKISRDEGIQEEAVLKHHLYVDTPSSKNRISDLTYLIVFLWMLVYCLLILPQLDCSQMPCFSNEE